MRPEMMSQGMMSDMTGCVARDPALTRCCRLGSAHLLEDHAGTAADRALDTADLPCPVALAAHILGHSRRARITFIARVQFRPFLLDCERVVRAARLVAHYVFLLMHRPALNERP